MSLLYYRDRETRDRKVWGILYILTIHPHTPIRYEQLPKLTQLGK